jgi:hypothetical protein
MNWHDHALDPEQERSNDVADSAALDASTGLFPGDSGRLPVEARRALCQLLSGPSVDAQRHSKLWPALLRSEAAIRSALADLFLELVLDREAGIAFTRQAETDELEAPVLLRSSPLTFIDSVLLLHLRQQLAEADARGLRAVVEQAQLGEALAVYEKNLSTDRAGFLRRVGNAVQKMKDNHILTRLRGEDERYEVSPALKLLFSAEDVAALAQVYRQLREDQLPPEDDAEPAQES